MQHIVFIIPPANFRDEEILIPAEILGKVPVHIDIASTARKMVKGVKGKLLRPTLTLEELNTDSYDAVVVVGGPGTKKFLWGYKPLLVFLQSAHRQHKLICGICAGSVVLAHAGILKDVAATTFDSEEYIKELRKAGAQYTAADLVWTGDIITASGPQAAGKFGEEIRHALEIRSNAEKKVHESISIPLATPFNDV